MSKAQNRHDTRKWKARRKDHFGDMCDNAKCGICALHKRHKGAGKYFNKNQQIAENNKNFKIDTYDPTQDELIDKFNWENRDLEEY